MKLLHRGEGRRCKSALLTVAVAALAGVSLFVASATASAKLTTFTFGTQGSNFLIDIAKDQGYFKKQGIDPQIVNFAAPAAEFAALSGGQVDAILVAPNVLLAQDAGRTSGSRYVYFENFTSMDLNIVVRPGLTVPSVKKDGFAAAMRSLKGKTFGVPAFGGIFDVIPRQMMKAAGMDPDTDVKFVVVAYGQTARTALQTGTIDAYAFESPFAAPSIADDGDSLLVSSSDPQVPSSLHLKTMMEAGYAAVDSTIQQHLTTYRAVDRAMLQAKAFLLNATTNAKNKAFIQRLAQQDFNMSTKAAAQFVALGGPALLTPPLTCAPLGVALTNLIKWGVAKPPLPGCSDLFERVLTVKQVNAILAPPKASKKK